MSPNVLDLRIKLPPLADAAAFSLCQWSNGRSAESAFGYLVEPWNRLHPRPNPVPRVGRWLHLLIGMLDLELVRGTALRRGT
jgi:hypothetical protein